MNDGAFDDRKAWDEARRILAVECNEAIKRAMRLSGYQGDPAEYDTEEPPPEGTEAYEWWVTANQIAKAMAKLDRFEPPDPKGAQA